MDVIQASESELRFMRYELTDYELKALLDWGVKHGR